MGTNDIISKAQLKKAQRSLHPIKAQRKMRDLIFLISEAQRNFRNELSQHDSAIAERHFRTKLKRNLTSAIRMNFTTQRKYRIFLRFETKKEQIIAKEGRHLLTLRSNGTKLRSMYRNALLTEKKIESAAQLKRNKF